MRKWIMSLAILTTLTLNSCGVVEDSIEKAGDEGKELITHMKEEIGKLKTETLAEIKITIEDTMPQVVESILNADAIAFLIVAVTALGSLVVIVALLLLLGAAKAFYKRWG